MARRRTLLAPADAALAQCGCPSHPVTRVNPLAAGRQSDPIGRLVNARLQRALGQSFVPDDKLGADRTVGGQCVARAAADRRTLLLGTTIVPVIAPFVNRPRPNDPAAAFAAVAALTETPMRGIPGPPAGAAGTAGGTQFMEELGRPARR